MAFLLSRLARSTIAPLSRNIKTEEFISGSGGGLHGVFQIPNYRRAPFWKYFWVQHFVTRQHVFNIHHTGYIVLCVFFWWTGAFATAPIERREKYYMHSPKFRLQSAYANPGTRPAAKIAQEQAKVRYFYRGYDHAFTLNELKDFYFKLRENWLIQHYPGIQYPFVHRQLLPEKTEEPLKRVCHGSGNMYCDLPDEGATFKKQETLCTLESVKAVGEVYAPADCEVVAVNETLGEEPALVNSSPQEDGWLVKIKLSGDLSDLMDEAAYQKHADSVAADEE